MPCVLSAAIIAQPTNLALTGIARASEFSYQQLEWAWEQCCREQTLTAASACLVDYHHQLPLTHARGPGRLSSSDGQRFSSRTHGPGVAALPRYFGHHRRGLQIYSWTSDQYSQYAGKVVAATVRDAMHTLDRILDNRTVLPIEEHTTDTHGYFRNDLRHLPPPRPAGSRRGSAAWTASASPPRHAPNSRRRGAAQAQAPPEPITQGLATHRCPLRSPSHGDGSERSQGLPRGRAAGPLGRPAPAEPAGAADCRGLPRASSSASA